MQLLLFTNEIGLLHCPHYGKTSFYRYVQHVYFEIGLSFVITFILREKIYISHPVDLQHHFELNPEHKVVEIAVYRRSLKKLEKRLCAVHEQQELTFGCPGCYNTFCMMCLPENISCPSGQDNIFFIKRNDSPNQVISHHSI